MKSKTIAKICAGKHAAWLKSIKDENVRKIAANNTIITGGAIVSMLLNEPVNDFDLYFRTPEAAKALADYYVAELLKNPPSTFKGDANREVKVFTKLEPAVEGSDHPARVRIVVQSAGIAGETRSDYQYFEGMADNPEAQAEATDAYVSGSMGDPEPGQITDPTEPEFHAASHDHDDIEGYVAATEAADDQAAAKLDEVDKEDDKGKKEDDKRGRYHVQFVTSNAITLSHGIQLVIRFTGEPDQIHENYDFVHCTSSWTSWDKKLHLRPEALECILTKELRYIGSKYPICSVIRTRKFITRGWTINAGQYVKMCWQISQLDMSNPRVLEDQLVGVDSAYFAEVIRRLADAPDPQKIDGTYLMTLVDRIFN